jgi:hypothetical protein
VRAVNLTPDQTILALNGNALLIPAPSAKLTTCAVALYF